MPMRFFQSASAILHTDTRRSRIQSRGDTYLGLFAHVIYFNLTLLLSIGILRLSAVLQETQGGSNCTEGPRCEDDNVFLIN